MARGRLISRSLGSSRKFHALLTVGGKLGEFCQVLFPLLVANTDDFGRMPADAFTVKNVVLPSSRRHERDFDQALAVLHTVGLIARYVVDGSEYLEVLQFDEHQANLHKRTKSRYPELPEAPGNSGSYRPNLTELNRTELKGTQSNRAPGAKTREADQLFEQFWKAYPKKKSKEEALRAWEKRRPDLGLLGLMLTAIKVQAKSEDWRKEHGRYVPLPATWLNGARWTDVVDVDIGAPPQEARWIPWNCTHDPKCGNRATCAFLDEKAKLKAVG